MIRVLEASSYFINQNDPRQAYVLIRGVMAHPNSSYVQRYEAYENLAAVFNCSRHTDIIARSRIDISRTDRQLNDMLHFLLEESGPRCTFTSLSRVTHNISYILRY